MTHNLGAIVWGVSGGWPRAGVIALFLACVMFAILFYRPQMRALPRLWWIVMLMLRVGALVMICMSLLQPSAFHTKNPENGGVAILIDRSKSMAAIDTGDEPAQQVATAAALNLFPIQLRDNQSIALEDAVAKLNPLLDETRPIVAEQQYEQLTHHENSHSPRSLDELKTKWQIAMTGLANEPLAASLIDWMNHFDQPGWLEQAQKEINDLVTKLAAQQRTSDDNLYKHDSVVRQACDKLITMTRLQRAQAAIEKVVEQLPASTPIYGAVFDSALASVALRENGKPTWPRNVTASGDESDISGAIRQLTNQIGDDQLRAVLLFTDGDQVGGSLTISAKDNAPIFPVQCAGTPSDLVLSNVTSPIQAYLGEPVTVKAQIRSTNLGDIPITVRLRAGDVTETQTLRLDRAGVATARLNVPMLRSGSQPIRVQLEPIPGEASDQNNRAEIHVATEPRRMRIALLASFPTRDFQFLRDELEQATWIDSKVVLPPARMSPAELREQDVIILDDLAARELDASQWIAIRESAQRNGSGLILIAGGNHLPNEYLSNPMLASLLPFDARGGLAIWRTWAGAEAYFRFLPAEANLPFLQLEDDASDVMHQWDRLPAMYHYLQMPPLRASVQRLAVERESSSPVLTQMPLGKGRVLFVGFNETWRWRSLSAGMQQRFWMQLFHRAASLDGTQQQSQTAELADLSPQSALLSRLSATAQVYSLSSTPILWKNIQLYEKDHPQISEYALWRSPWLFALILGCFGSEWALRKRFGLA